MSLSDLRNKLKEDLACLFRNPMKTGQWVLTSSYMFFLGMAFDAGGFDPSSTMVASSAAVYGGLMTALNSKRRS